MVERQRSEDDVVVGAEVISSKVTHTKHDARISAESDLGSFDHVRREIEEREMRQWTRRGDQAGQFARAAPEIEDAHWRVAIIHHERDHQALLQLVAGNQPPH
jgi:hypothetical protein